MKNFLIEDLLVINDETSIKVLERAGFEYRRIEIVRIWERGEVGQENKKDHKKRITQMNLKLERKNVLIKNDTIGPPSLKVSQLSRPS